MTVVDSEKIPEFELLSSQLNFFDIFLNFNEDYLLSLFIQLFDSNVLKEKYLVGSDYYQKLVKDHPKSKNTFIFDAVKNFNITYSKSDKKMRLKIIFFILCPIVLIMVKMHKIA